MDTEDHHSTEPIVIVTLASQKGGSGKTTTALCIADEWYDRGNDVLLLDADPQGTAITWGDVADEKEEEGPTVAKVEDNFHKRFPDLAEEFDHVVIDCPPGDADHSRSPETPRQRSALFVADLALVPCGPGINDIWSVKKTFELVAEAREYRSSLRAGIVLTRLDSRTILGDKARQALEEAPLPLLESTLGDRVAYQEMPATGVGVTRYQSSGKAGEEVRSLVSEIESMEASS